MFRTGIADVELAKKEALRDRRASSASSFTSVSTISTNLSRPQSPSHTGANQPMSRLRRDSSHSSRQSVADVRRRRRSCSSSAESSSASEKRQQNKRRRRKSRSPPDRGRANEPSASGHRRRPSPQAQRANGTTSGRDSKRRLRSMSPFSRRVAMTQAMGNA